MGVVTFSFRMRHLNLLYCREEVILDFTTALFLKRKFLVFFFFIRVCALRYLEHFQQGFFLYLKPLEGLLLLDDFLAQGLQTGEVVARYAPVEKCKR